MKTSKTRRTWTSIAVAAAPEGPSKSTVVVATRFVIRRRRDNLPFLRAALVSAREAEAVRGFLGGTVLADLWNRMFWTVSVWSSPEAIRTFGSAPSHAKAIRRAKHWAAESQVERWLTSASKVPTFAETAHWFGVPPPHRGLVRRLRPLHPVRASSDPIASRPDHRSTVTPGLQPLPGDQHHDLTKSTQGF